MIEAGHPAVLTVAGVAALWLTRRAVVRLRLSVAKHPSLQGHAKIARRVSRWIRAYDLDDERFFDCDGAPADVAARRREAFAALAAQLRARLPAGSALTAEAAEGLSDLQFVNAYRVPFPFRRIVQRDLAVNVFFTASDGPRLRDLDGNESWDLTGSYGVNLLGHEAYKRMIDAGADAARPLGPLLGPYHPLVVDNVRRLRALSGLDEVSFHMSGTEAIMQAVRLARYHTGRSHLVRFCGAYHGWWDGVQPGVGSMRSTDDVYTLRDQDERSLRILRTRSDIACVLINPLQALHPNAGAQADGSLVLHRRLSSGTPRQDYADWLRRLRQVCDERGIALIFDEVFLGFRLAPGGAQEYFGVRADLVTYGKTLGGGLPVGALCGRHEWMKRFDDNRPSHICFARGTFNSHPYVMGAMDEFLRHVEAHGTGPEPTVWAKRAEAWNRRFEAEGLPVRVASLASVWTVLYTQAGRHHWMLQYYLRAEGLTLSWVGTGRLIFSHDFSDADMEEVGQRFLRAACRMRDDGWWWTDADHQPSRLRNGLLREMWQARRAGRS
jgi:glutamate-1-semialdehyde 2,1-aminomutase